MPRLTLAAATAAHSHLHALFSSPQEITWDRLILYLDLLAHLERIDSKLTRTAQAYLASDEGLTREQEAVVTVYARDEEGRRKRRNTYVGWSLMLRRYVGPSSPITHHPHPLTHVSLSFAHRQYLNDLLITTHSTDPSARLTPLLESAVYRLLPPTGWEYPSPAPLFVRNIQGGEQSVVDKTDEAYEDVVVAYDEQGYVILSPLHFPSLHFPPFPLFGAVLIRPLPANGTPTPSHTQNPSPRSSPRSTGT
jgi:hypothetical protein